MVRLVRDKENRISVQVTASVDYSGFSASLSIPGVEKIISDLSARNMRIDFSPAEVESVGKNAQCVLTVYNAEGEVYVNNIVWFETVATESEALGHQVISIVLVSLIKYEGGKSRPDEELDKIIEEKVDKAMTESVDAKVEECVDEIIDDKVAGAVDTILEGEVKRVVSAVIDEKVDARIDELLDSSDSDALGGVINTLQDAVYENILPRVVDVESELSKKISVKQEDSDENMVFFTSAEDSDVSSGV